jgi:ABC-type sugar transport system substrate-binding protein
VVLQNRSTDPYSADRLSSLTDALTTAGQPYEIHAFEGDATAASAALQSLLAVPSKVAIVLAEEDQGLAGSRRTLTLLGEKGQAEFVLGGYGSYDLYSSDYVIVKCAAYGDRCVGAYAVAAFRTVRSLMEGKPVGDRIEVPMIFYRASTIDAPKTPRNEAPPPNKSAGS